MPHVELKYSADLDLDAKAILAAVEGEINAKDAGAGICKSRAYPAESYLHTHLLVSVAMLPKAHRDEDYLNDLAHKLENAVKAHLSVTCYFSLEITFTPPGYVTNEFVAG